MIRRLSAIAAIAVFLASAAPASAQPDDPETRPRLGLMGTLPIYWGEAEGLGDILTPGERRHWVRDRLELQFDLLPLDWLDAAALAPLRQLMLAQPRALSPQENVALDDWVRGGGQLLLFADPMLTGESRFAVGDRRRPQDVVLLSPILDHWGLRLEYDAGQPAGARHVDAEGATVPVRLAGRLVTVGTARDCTVGVAGLLARCRIGEGAALIVADAALLDLHDADPAAANALSQILRQAFPKIGDAAGIPGTEQKIHDFQCDTNDFSSPTPLESGRSGP